MGWVVLRRLAAVRGGSVRLFCVRAGLSRNLVYSKGSPKVSTVAAIVRAMRSVKELSDEESKMLLKELTG